tara:strand:+ start:717 stop:992 length:276 start_codon:yes stop_codon:yes gene_type:complete
MEYNNANCDKCKYQGRVPGSTHTSCKHPNVGNDTFDAIVSLVEGMMGKTNALDKLNIRADPHGVKSGWFNWPVDFDPAWLKHCEGYKNDSE